jgi:hypothetical protein
LFEDRNGIAHKGATVDTNAARDHVQTARDAFTFMDSIEATHGGGKSPPAPAAPLDDDTSS